MSRLFFMLLLVSASVYGELFPSTVTRSVTAAGEQSVTLDTAFPVDGMSGIVIHDYGNGLRAVSARVVRNGDRYELMRDDSVRHDKIPTVKTEVQNGDKVIGGYLYDNVMLIAPDAKSYADITSMYDKQWFHPDLLAIFLAQKGESVPTRSLLKSFAQKHHIGLFLILKKDRIVALDPVSGKFVGNVAYIYTATKAKFPFYTRLEKIDAGFFSSKPKQTDYYKLVEEM